MKIKYKLKKLYPKIWLVESNNFDLAMLFFRVQEYYENPKYKGKIPSTFELITWYAKQNNGIFSYADDYVGFNVPSSIIHKFCADMFVGDDTVYDVEFDKIYTKICDSGEEKFYLIGCPPKDKRILVHEIAHAFYNLYPDYKKKMDELTQICFSKSKLKKIKKVLGGWKYHKSVMMDEIQAYAIDPTPPKDINKYLKPYRSKYKKIFKEFSKNI